MRMRATLKGMGLAAAVRPALMAAGIAEDWDDLLETGNVRDRGG